MYKNYKGLKMIRKEILKEDGNYQVIKIWMSGETYYRVQENRYGAEWDWEDFGLEEDAIKSFDEIIAKKASENEEEGSALSSSTESPESPNSTGVEADGDLEKSTTFSKKIEVLDLNEIENQYNPNGNSYYVYTDTQEIINPESIKITVDDIINNSKITYSYIQGATDDWGFDEGELLDVFFIQVDYDDNSHFSIFMDFYKQVNPNENVSFFDDVDAPMECFYYYPNNSENTQKLIGFLSKINAKQTKW